ncbi:MAG: hypothetical protein J7K94_03100 [Dehalococcoidia bacterium]|nr:hypothetical protein [Dehalococcoidia bacterium]
MKQAKGKSSKRGLPWFAWLSIGLGVVTIIVLACILPTGQTANLSNSSAAIVDQLYAFNYQNQEFIDDVTDSLESYGFQVDLYQGDDVSVDLYRNLPEHGYKVIIFRAHSGLVQAGGQPLKTSLFTNEGYSRSKYVGEQLNEELLQARVDEGSPYYFAIDAKFITDRMKGRFDNTAIVMTGCSGLYLQDLAQSFIRKGASTYLAWDKTVGLEYVDDATITLIKNLCVENLTIEKAVSKTMEQEGPDPEYHAMLKYYPQQSHDRTLKELTGGLPEQNES